MKIIIALLLVLFVLLQYRIWLDDGGIPEILQLEDNINVVQAEVKRLRERNKELEAEVMDLKQGLDAIEERARNELGMIKDEEIYYQVIESLEETSASAKQNAEAKE